MGNSQSNFTEEPSRTLIIDEWEIPDAYKNVGVSDEVVTSVTQIAPKLPSQPTFVEPKIQDQNVVIPEEPVSKKSESSPSNLSETVERIKHRYFGYHVENVCTQVEEELTRCLKSNKSTVLNCKPLQFSYDQCIKEHSANGLQKKEVKAQ